MVTFAQMAPHEPDEFLVRLFREHGAALRQYLRQLLPNRADVEDVEQATYAKLYQVPRPKPITNPRAWLFTAAARVASNYRRSQRRRPAESFSAESEQVADGRPLPEDDSIGQDAMRHLDNILRELPAQQRTVFIHQRIFGESREDIAAFLGITLNTFDQHLGKAVATVRQRLKALGLGVQGGDQP